MPALNNWWLIIFLILVRLIAHTYLLDSLHFTFGWIWTLGRDQGQSSRWINFFPCISSDEPWMSVNEAKQVRTRATKCRQWLSMGGQANRCRWTGASANESGSSNDSKNQIGSRWGRVWASWAAAAAAAAMAAADLQLPTNPIPPRLDYTPPGMSSTHCSTLSTHPFSFSFSSLFLYFFIFSYIYLHLNLYIVYF